MIKININNDLITVEGHAGYDTKGKDIVCASVSSIIYTTVNGILNIDKSAIDFVDNGNLLKIKILDKKSSVVKTLLDNMITLLEDLESQYPENLKIRKGD